MGSVYEIWNAPNTHRVRMAEYNAAVSVRGATNRLQGAQVSLAEFSRTLANWNRMESAGVEYNEAVSSAAQGLESRTTLRVNASLAAADTIGRLTAQSAALGVGGTSVDLLNGTVELQRNIEQDLQRITTERTAGQQGRQAAQIIDNAASKTDLSQAFGNFDYTINVIPKPLKHRALKLLGVAAATYFGGPQAGQAAADMAVGEWKANNGDFTAAGQYFGRAASGAIASIDDWGGGDSNSNSWFGRVMEKSKAVPKDQEVEWGSLGSEEGESAFGSGFGSDWFSGFQE